MNIEKAYEGKYIIVRSYDSGCHAGYLKSYNEETRHVCLTKSRRLWKWIGFTLSEVANDGMANDEAKLCQELEEIIVANVIELIPCTAKAEKNISKYPVFVPNALA
jgi:hypothetical protein